ncbi:uncharacterized protein At5g39865 [Cynara cardunculus var. scolymus]|uniref:Glutaredoxin n=1 Tax=Cynara cardunculus var. scolymus TaxID=59895 RepID=A0A103Y714_CYNCS|nr:uncharacterized protein At5g39865 [Cynara cardunculus var. scolymus]KVI03685.1 Glutaredoxin [Cynara cardunculus var. scolymus]
MWPIRIKSTRNHHSPSYNNNDHSPRTPSNPDFNHQSFKDIETLFPHVDLNNAIQEQPSSSSSSPTCSADLKRRSVFHRVHLANRITRAFSIRPKPSPEEILTEPNQIAAAEKSEKLEKPENSIKSQPRIPIPGAEKRVVIYVTSLRVVRSTFEACRTVRSIFQGFRVPIDERDLTMDASFFDEIRKIMAQIGQGEPRSSRVDLPRVFIGGRYIGGADEVVELHEIGELKKLVEGLPAATPGVCNFCGGFRFILCLECNGSHKCHIEDGGFRTCTECNENGLIRCPSCLST